MSKIKFQTIGIKSQQILFSNNFKIFSLKMSNYFVVYEHVYKMTELRVSSNITP